MIDRGRLVDLALRLVSTPSFTGSEEQAARLMEAELESTGIDDDAHGTAKLQVKGGDDGHFDLKVKRLDPLAT